MDKIDNSLEELFNKYVITHIKYNESYEEKNVLSCKYDRIKERCDAKPYFFKNNREVMVKCYTDMFNACVAYENKREETHKLDMLKDEYHNELKKRNYYFKI